MDRELLIEIGSEEIPAGWLPDLTTQLARNLDALLKEFRLEADAATEGYSTPRRLTARVAKLAERQEDLEELVTGPPVSAAFAKTGEPTPAASGFAKKYGVDVSALERHETPKGLYLAHRVRQRGKATVDVLAEILGRLLRGMAFPKQMRWDAFLDDGKGDLVFARPIRWLVLMYGGRVVPFMIRRSELAEGPNVQEIRSGSQTYGHRFLTTSGRAGRAIKIKTFEDYQARLLENFVILDRSERESRIKRELEAHARRLGGRVSPSTSLGTGSAAAAHSALLQEVPDLVEYPAVVAGHYSVEFLELPQEVLTTTMIHHQHFFPVVDEEGKLKPAFLAVVNMEPEKPEIIARNAERVLAARLRDARFFWDADRETPLASRIDRLSTILFHKKLGTYREKADRVASLARWIAADALGQPAAIADQAELAGRLAKADLGTDMVRELTELQGTMGGIYAREEGQPEAVWKAIYYHYLPIGVEADAPPSRQQLGSAAVTWAAVSLADKLDSVVGMFWVGEKPTGSRDPLGTRRLGNGLVKLLADLPETGGLVLAPTLGTLIEKASSLFKERDKREWKLEDRMALNNFLVERCQYVLQSRGFDVRSVRAVTTLSIDQLSPLEGRLKAEALAQMPGSVSLLGTAELFKRVKNITKDVEFTQFDRALLREPAELALLASLDEIVPRFREAVAGRNYLEAFQLIGVLRAPVAQLFKDVMVMADDEKVRTARLRMLASLRELIMGIADISEIVTES